jgi:Glucose / Sorbosone dehydrogenase
MLFLALAGATNASAFTLDPLGGIDHPIVFDQPIYVSSDPGNPNRLFVVERTGVIKLVQGGSSSTFVDLTSVVDCCNREQGLWSMAPAPDFDTTGHFYVDYSSSIDGPGNINVDELTAEGNSAQLSTRRSLLTIPHTEDKAHFGGQLQFGVDGGLYVSTGDGGGSNDQFHHSQDLNSLLGKILRIDPEPSGSQPYTVPAGNPFPAATAPYNTIWSYGLRNPFRFSFDRATGDMVIGDVGQSQREEIDYAPFPALGGGGDYGWNCMEGSLAGPLPSDPQCLTPPSAGFVDPVFDYPHTDPGNGAAFGCAIIGGYVVRDLSLSGLYGRYLYTDLCTGDIRSLNLGNPFPSDSPTGLHVDDPNSFGEDSCGRIYVASGNGGVYRLQGATPPLNCPPPPAEESGLQSAYVRIKAERRKVQRNRTAFIMVWVSPCEDRKGQPVRLFRGRKPAGTKYLDRACSAHFTPRVPHRSTFTAFAPGNDSFLPATSRHLGIKTARHLRRPALP